MNKRDFEAIFSTFMLICDTREKENYHITNAFLKNGFKIVYDKLEFADYSCICCDFDFRDYICIERKMGINELANNLSWKRIQFENELEKAAKNNTRIQLIIENDNYIDILRENYKSRMKQKAIISSLNTYKFRYGLDYIFLDKSASASYIFNYFKYYIREYLKQNKVV